MKVRSFIGAEAAYACIDTPTVRLDVRLSPGRSTPQSLRESAKEWEAQAAQLLSRAVLAREAADYLDIEADNWPARDNK